MCSKTSSGVFVLLHLWQEVLLTERHWAPMCWRTVVRSCQQSRAHKSKILILMFSWAWNSWGTVRKKSQLVTVVERHPKSFFISQICLSPLSTYKLWPFSQLNLHPVKVLAVAKIQNVLGQACYSLPAVLNDMSVISCIYLQGYGRKRLQTAEEVSQQSWLDVITHPRSALLRVDFKSMRPDLTLKSWATLMSQHLLWIFWSNQ